MKNFVQIWKQKASAKDIQPKDIVAYSILRAMAAKSENKKEIAKYFVAKAFLKKRSESKYTAAMKAQIALQREIRWQNSILDVPIEDIFSSEEEFILFKDILDTMTFDFDRVYTYVFVRQDLAPEYQLVQAAHATMVLGRLMPKEFNPRETYFTVIGVADLKELGNVRKVLWDNNFKFEDFVEPDIGHQITAIATHPIHWMKRRPLKDYKLLTFSPNVEETVNI